MSSTGVHCLFIDYAKNLLDLPLSDDIVILKHNILKENPKEVGLNSLKVWRYKDRNPVSNENPKLLETQIKIKFQSRLQSA